MARNGKTTSEGVVEAQSNKLNSRVTKAHIGQLVDAMTVALDKGTSPSQRLGYLSYAVASVLKDVGLPASHLEISKRMFANYGAGETSKEV